MTWNPHRVVRRCLRDPGYFQVVAYGFAFMLGVVLLSVGPIILGSQR
jgi:hypothetical protein